MLAETRAGHTAQIDAANTLDPASVHRTLLANGLTVIVQVDHSAPVVAIVTYVKAGYFDEDDVDTGMAHVLEHMYFKGTPRRGVGEIAKATKASGGYLNAHTIYDNTTYYTVLPSARLREGLDIQSDAYANSLIDAAELARELEVIVQEAKRKEDNPTAVATENLHALLFDRHRMRRWRIGREEVLRGFTRDRLHRFYGNFYSPGNTVLVVSGDVDPEVALAEVTERYGELGPADVLRSAGPAEPDRRGFRYREMSGDITQTQLVIGWRTLPTLHHDTPVLDFAAELLGTGRASRLYRGVRERKLASSISCYNYSPTELGVFILHAECSPETAPEAATAAWAQVGRLRTEPAAEEEMDRIKNVFSARWLRRMETAEGRANHLAEWEALGGWELGNAYFDQFMSVTSDDVKRVSGAFLTQEKAAALVYRPDSAPRFAESPDALMSALEGAAGARFPIPALRATPPKAHSPSPGLEKTEAGVTVFRTPSGVPILVRRKTGAGIVNVGVYGAGGVLRETAGNAGITKLMMRASLKGTTTRTAAEIAEELEMLGAGLGSSAGLESFGWSLSVPLGALDRAVSLLGDIIVNAAYPEESVETERAAALSDLALMRDDMHGYPVRLAVGAAYGTHPYGNPPMGTRESLSRLDIGAIKEWHASRVLSGPMAIGIVGDVEPAAVASLLAGELGEIGSGGELQTPPGVWPSEKVSLVEQRDKAQTALALAFPAPGRRDPQRHAAQLIATVASGLGGRFFEELRDKRSLAYTVSAGVREMRGSGMFISYIAASPEMEDAARDGLLEEFARLRESPVSEDELLRATEYMVGTHAIARESGGAVLGEMMDAWLFGDGLSELESYEETIRGVSAEHMLSMARNHFEPARAVEGIVRGTARGSVS